MDPSPSRQPPKNSQEQLLPRPNVLVRIILDLSNIKQPLGRLHEGQVGAPPPLEAEIADRVVANQILERLLQQGKRRLKVDAVGCEDDVGVLRETGGRRLAPVVDGGGYAALEVVECDVLLHQLVHWDLVRDVQRGGCVGGGEGEGEAMRGEGLVSFFLLFLLLYPR